MPRNAQRPALLLSFNPISAAQVREFVTWRYEPPYDSYDISSPDDGVEEVEDAIRYFSHPSVYCQAITTPNGRLVGFCTFGRDGQVPGGDYRDDALDIGLGVRPDHTGRGLGHQFVRAVLDFAALAFFPVRFRVTIAGWNVRAQKVWQTAGFQRIQSFNAYQNSQPFIIFTKAVPGKS